MRRLPMRKIKDVLRLHAAGRSARQIGPSVGVGRSTVAEYLRRAEVAGLSWPLPEGLDEAALERLLFPPPPPAKGRQFAEPDWAAVHRELKRPGVTLALLWDEYRGQHPDGYGYSAFCEHYRRWTGRLSPVMRQRHAAGERMFVPSRRGRGQSARRGWPAARAGLSEVTTKRGLAPLAAAARHPFRLGDDPAAAAPAQLRRPAEVGEAAGRPAARLGVVLGPGELDVDMIDEARVAREAARSAARARTDCPLGASHALDPGV